LKNFILNHSVLILVFCITIGFFSTIDSAYSYVITDNLILEIKNDSNCSSRGDCFVVDVYFLEQGGQIEFVNIGSVDFTPKIPVLQDPFPCTTISPGDPPCIFPLPDAGFYTIESVENPNFEVTSTQLGVWVYNIGLEQTINQFAAGMGTDETQDLRIKDSQGDGYTLYASVTSIGQKNEIDDILIDTADDTITVLMNMQSNGALSMRIPETIFSTSGDVEIYDQNDNFLTGGGKLNAGYYNIMVILPEDPIYYTTVIIQGVWVDTFSILDPLPQQWKGGPVTYTGQLVTDKDNYFLGTSVILTLFDKDRDADSTKIDKISLDEIIFGYENLKFDLNMELFDPKICKSPPSSLCNSTSDMHETGQDTGIFGVEFELPHQLLDTTIIPGDDLTIRYIDQVNAQGVKQTIRSIIGTMVTPLGPPNLQLVDDDGLYQLTITSPVHNHDPSKNRLYRTDFN